ncbi:PREDICTED: uncharacterized protein LOC107358010 [Acropora digitifera]|uniref:uncharacterized protein LOC107358010 n=1 Tax=Acropora digitifera TaxID=70779 RepID=UPI00077A4F21|nr:PREDICTED: uncharacterized protein LOC107358010 [Acropora digitifera]
METSLYPHGTFCVWRPLHVWGVVTWRIISTCFLGAIYLPVIHKSVVWATNMGNYQVGGWNLKEPGLIYIIQEATTDNFKVGVSKNENNLNQRLQNLQCGNWRKLTIKRSYKVSNMKLAEQDAHHTLMDVQIHEGGGQEWFHSDFQTIKDAVKGAARKYHR